MPNQVGGGRKLKLFDDVMIAGVELVATHRVLAGLRLFPPQEQDRSWYFSQVTAIAARRPWVEARARAPGTSRESSP